MEIKRKPAPSLAPVGPCVVQRPLTANPPPPYSPPASPYIAYSPFSHSPHSPQPGHSPNSAYFPPPPPCLTPGRAPSPSPFPTPSLQPPRTLPRYRSQPNLRSPPSPSSPPSPQPRPSVPRAETSLPATDFEKPNFYTDAPPAADAPPATDPEKSTFYADARHFLGGLIHHPSESTKHYSILRHSHGIIFYRGPATSVTVSIFADAQLPADRSLWLQCKGWSGKTGMRAKALFRQHDDWLNVTPSVVIRTDQVDPNKERAWQRDMTRFHKKASNRVRDTHHLRETVVSRIPPDAEDGYFQLVLCRGEKKVLCRSPVFRIVSTSFDPSSLRGASLTTMPLELGALVAGKYAQVMASKVMVPATAVANTAHARYRPKWLKEGTIRSAYGAIQPDPAGHPDTAIPPSIENGPESPYPLDFTARLSPSVDPMRIPVKIPWEIQDRLRGYFFGWARPGSGHPWEMIILSVQPWDSSQHTGPITLSQTTRKVGVLRLLHDSFPEPHPTTLAVRLLGFLHPDIPPPSARTEKDLAVARQAAADEALMADQYDTEYAQALLDHPLWGPDAAGGRGWLDRTKDGAGNAIARGHKMIELIGVRSGVEQESMGGYYIVRG